MFWGITLENGKVYSQIVEQSFHISMAALGFENLTTEPTTVMVECEKADYALCTLQAGKIPQQPLDLNFTEGEEVKFFLEGDGGVVHLTGYLLETPREYEFDEDGLDDLLSSEEEEEEEATSSDESQQDEIEAKNAAKDSSDEMEVVGSCDFKLEEKAQKKRVDLDNDDDDEDEESNDDDDDDDDDDDAGVSWQQALIGDLNDEGDPSERDDNEWDPKKSSKRSKRKVNIKKAKQKARQPISKTLVELMDIADDSEESSDEDWAPQTDTKTDTSIENTEVNESQHESINNVNDSSS